jgi:flagellar biosynthetic protein FlhB
MAADDAGEKTEAPTAHRRAQARQEGRVAISQELSSTLALLAGLLVLQYGGESAWSAAVQMLRQIGDAPPVDEASLGPWMLSILAQAGYVMLPLLGLLLAVVVLVGLFQTRGVVAWKKLNPRWEQASPMSGVKRLLSPEGLSRSGLALVKFLLVAAVAVWVMRGLVNRLLTLPTLELPAVAQIAFETALSFAWQLVAVLLVIAAFDYLLEWWKLERSLRMTRKEVLDELKNMEGDPHIRQRRRQLQMKLAMQRLRMDVPKADVIVTNPTEYAVALEYGEEMAAPRVVAKGKDFMALHIRQLAAEFGIPIVQRPPLARALFASVDVGEEVPPSLYRAVAEVLAYVYQLSGRAVSARA